MLAGELVAALPENDQLRGTPILVTDRRGDAWTTTLTDVEATPRSWSPIPAGRAGEPTPLGVVQFKVRHAVLIFFNSRRHSVRKRFTVFASSALAGSAPNCR